MATAASGGRAFIRSFLKFSHISTPLIRINPFPRSPRQGGVLCSSDHPFLRPPCVLSRLPCLSSSDHHKSKSYSSPHLHPPFLCPRNPSRWISCSTADPKLLGSTPMGMGMGMEISKNPHPSFPRPRNPRCRCRIPSFPRPRNPRRRRRISISCSAADLKLSSHKASPHNLESTIIRMGSGTMIFEKPCERGMEQQEACKKHEDFFPIEKEKSLDADDPHLPAIVTCASEKHEYHYSESEKTTLHFSTFNADGALLKQFSVQVNSHQPFVVSACRNFVLLEGSNAFLCNIATQDLITIPGITANFMPFGYVTSTEEFKLLGDFSHGDFSFFKSDGLKVLTLGTDRWRDAKDPPLPIRMFRTTDGAFVNGALYFLTQDRRIASFDLEREEWGLIMGPPVSRSFHDSLVEFSGHLCMVGGSPDSIWLLDNNSGSWIQVCTIHQPFQFQITGIENDGRILLQTWESNTDDSLLLYDPKTKSSREIQSFQHPASDECFYIKVFSSLGHRWSLCGETWLP